MSNEENPWARTVEPTIEPYGHASRSGATIERHPAYAVIQANRVGGDTSLFQSDFRHNGFIRISIARAEVVRDLSNDWVHSSNMDRLIEVDVSEAHWAHFVSAMNIGAGTPCTLRQIDRQPIPGIARPTNRHEQFKRESSEAVQRSMQHLQALRNAIAESGLSQKKQKELLDHVMFAERGVGSTQDFVAEQFGEHIERTVEHAKAEVSGYVNGAIRQVGLQALAAGSAQGVAPLKLGFPGEES